jgi:hypothetical protein
MTDAERIQQLTTNLKASLALNNLKQAQINASNPRNTATGFLGRIKTFFSK